MGNTVSGQPDVVRWEARMAPSMTANVWRVLTSASIAIFRQQSSGNILIGGSSTDSTNVGFEKLSVQGASTETSNLSRWLSGISGTTDWAINNRAVVATGRIKTAVKFTDDNATPASSKTFAFDDSEWAAATDHSFKPSDRDGYLIEFAGYPSFGITLSGQTHSP